MFMYFLLPDEQWHRLVAESIVHFLTKYLMNYATLNKIGFPQSSTELVRSLFFIHVLKMGSRLFSLDYRMERFLPHRR